MPRGGNMGVKHADLLALVRDYLAIRGAWQVKVWGNSMMRSGLPDLLAILPDPQGGVGHACAIEIKTGPTARLSFKQEVERTAILRAGGLYIVVREIEQLEEALLSRGLVAAPLLGQGGRARGP